MTKTNDELNKEIKSIDREYEFLNSDEIITSPTREVSLRGIRHEELILAGRKANQKRNLFVDLIGNRLKRIKG